MTALRRGAWVGLKYVTTLFFAGVIVQFFLVGYGLFAMKHGGNTTIDNAKSLDAHRGLGFILSDFGAILLLILALLAWPAASPPDGMDTARGTGVRAGDSRAVGFHHWGVGMFHPVNALLLLGLSGRLAHYAWTSGKTAGAAETAPPAAAPSG
jgi:hypothetical protein